MEDLLLQFGELAGFAALVTFVVNALKSTGVVKDGQAQNWVAGLNLLGLAGLLAVNVFNPELDVTAIDAEIGEFTQVAMVVFAYIFQMLSSRVSYLAVKNVPVIGKSNSQ